MTADAPEPPALAAAGFVRLGPIAPVSPIVIAVPHAGRDYAPALLALSRLPRHALESIEDRHADALAEPAIAAGAVAIVACRARAWIDLNRDPREIDPAMVEPPPPAHETLATAKVRGGVGLVPRRIAEGGEIWRRRLLASEIDARIAVDHAPYHAAIAAALAAATARFGTAVLIDLHSMPPLALARGAVTVAMVIGDRHGQSAAPALVERAAAAARAAGLGVALNQPYSGGYTLERHAAPAQDRHALQIEIDRAAYLATGLRSPSDALPRIAALVATIAAELADTAITIIDRRLAAE